MDHIDRLVHPDARVSEATLARHRSFIATRLGLSLAGLAALPLSLAAGHVPTLWEAVALAWLTLPLCAAAYLSRTGRLPMAETIGLAAWAGLSVTACLGGGLSLGGAWALLLMIPLEAATSSDPRLVRTGLLITLPAILALGAFRGLALLPSLMPAPAATEVAIIGPALVYALLLAFTAAAQQRLQLQAQRLIEQRHRFVLETSGDLVLHADRAGGVLTASRQAEGLFGIRPRDLLERGLFEHIHVADRPAFLKLFDDAALSGEKLVGRLRLRISLASDGGSRAEHPAFAWIEIRAKRVETGRADIIPTVAAVVRDITDRVDREQAMLQAKVAAERASAWKDGILTNVSHELRTPLNAIIGFAEMLSDVKMCPADSAKQRDYAATIAKAGHHLLSVVTALLDLSKLEAGRFDIDPEPFDVEDLIQTCCAMVGLKAEQAGIALHRERSPEIDPVIGDPRACRQIVINLLSNALKFTPRGGQVTIGAKPQGNSVLIVVADTGIGIAARDLTSLGDAFFQARSSYGAAEGTGLGLSLVRGLVGLHGGSIALESAPGEGTCVSVRLPLDCRNAAASRGVAKIETIPRYSRLKSSASLADLPKVQKIA